MCTNRYIGTDVEKYIDIMQLIYRYRIIAISNHAYKNVVFNVDYFSLPTGVC